MSIINYKECLMIQSEGTNTADRSKSKFQRSHNVIFICVNVHNVLSTPIVGISNLLKAYLARWGSLHTHTNKLRRCAGSSLAAGKATSVGQVLGTVPSGWSWDW